MISVIVPVYKVEAYLPRCVDSILRQTYQDFELILVDDGSPDRCGMLCDEYAEKDNRIKVIHKKNGGLSDARNAGLSIADGAYFAFVDSDDWVTPDYLEKLLSGLLSTDSDICECEKINTFASSELPFVEATQCTYETQDALELLIKDQVFHQYVWNKLYKRECLKEIKFEVGKTNEDEFWTYQVFGNARHVTKISDILYYYFQREDSIMGTGFSLKRLDALEAKLQRQIYLEQNFTQVAALGKVNLFESCIFFGQMTLLHLTGETRLQAKKRIDSVVRTNQLSKDELRVVCGSQKLWVRIAQIDFWMTCRVKNLLKKGL